MAKQGREVDPKWEWTEANVWTERMLATLEKEVKGGKWYSLIRGRLRAILRRRNRLKGWVRMRDHKLWPNAYFMSLGLFSLATARATESQPRKRTH